MSEVIKKLNESPSFDGKEIKDELGRKIVLRKPDILDRFSLMKALGSDSSNQAVLSMAITTIYVAAIDGSPVPTPRTALECESGLKRLGEEGFEAVTQALNEFFKEKEKDSKEIIKK